MRTTVVLTRLVLLVVVCASSLAFGPEVFAQTPQPASSPQVTQPDSPDSPEQQLAELYAPVVFVREQHSLCDDHGEQFLPVPVELVLGDPRVTLRRHATVVESTDPVVATAPTAQDLAGKDETHYLDLPGNARLPGCTYEEWFWERLDETGLPPTVYARIATEPGRPGELALQYWFYWAFDEFNNTHESDWEMFQLNFDADTAAEALTQDPSLVAMAQHAGGEDAQWDDPKVLKQDTHIEVYPAAGSHATYYGDAIWLGWGHQGTGFGCDNTDVPVDETQVEVVLLPENPDPNGPFGWLLFDGRWGERQSWEFNGPRNLNAGAKWNAPISWTDDLRPTSLSISTHETIGPGPAQIFCTVARLGGTAARLFPLHPRLVGAATGVVLIALLAIAAWNWKYIWRALKLIGRNPRLYWVFPAVLLPVAYLSARFEDFLRSTEIGEIVTKFFSEGGAASATLGFGFGSLQFFILMGVVAPGVIHATHDLAVHDRVGVRESLRVTARRLPATISALLLNTVLLILMVATIILIPLAIARGVQWLYTAHAVTVEGASVRQARHVSRDRVKGRWLRTLSMSILITVITGIPGPLVGNLLLVFGVVPLAWTEIIAGVLYAISFTVALTASTVYYLRIDEVAVVALPETGPTWQPTVGTTTAPTSA